MTTTDWLGIWISIFIFMTFFMVIEIIAPGEVWAKLIIGWLQNPDILFLIYSGYVLMWAIILICIITFIREGY